jgi:predicted DNA-binding protein YlxM (UPF0122 family)
MCIPHKSRLIICAVYGQLLTIDNLFTVVLYWQRKTSIVQLARSKQISRQTVFERLKNDDWQLSDFSECAALLDYDVRLTIIDRQTSQQTTIDILPPD